MKVEMNNLNTGYAEANKVDSKKIERVPNGRLEKEGKVDTENKGTSEKDAQKIRETVEKMNEELKKVDTSIRFKVHESHDGTLNRISIKVIERESEKVIMEIPSEESIEFSEKMDEITGMLFDHSR